MRKAGSTYELGRAAFAKGTLKFTNDERMMVIIDELDNREDKHKEIVEWKQGWTEAKAEAEAVLVEAALTKKKKKKKVSKKKSKK